MIRINIVIVSYFSAAYGFHNFYGCIFGVVCVRIEIAWHYDCKIRCVLLYLSSLFVEMNECSEMNKKTQWVKTIASREIKEILIEWFNVMQYFICYRLFARCLFGMHAYYIDVQGCYTRRKKKSRIYFRKMIFISLAFANSIFSNISRHHCKSFAMSFNSQFLRFTTRCALLCHQFQWD